MMNRGFDFLREKYYEILIPNLFTSISDKMGTFLDVIIVGFLISSTQLPALDIVSPFFLISAVIYTLYGQGGSLLSIKAKSDLNNEKSNIYFTFSIIGAIIICLIYMLFIFIFADSLLHLLNIPQDIFNTSKIYLLIISGFFTLNAYIRVLGYFLKADGQAGTTFNAILIANITNLCLDVLLFNLFEQKIVGIALALVLGYLVGAIYISKYFFNKNATFKLIPLRKIRLRNLFIFKIKALKKTPELVGRILIVLKTTVIVYLCGTYLGDAGLLAFLIYDNLETILYMFVSGIIKTISPFLTVFYNEKDYPSVEYMERLSTKHVLIFIISIGAIIFAFPEKILEMFNITAVHDQMIIAPAIRITSIGLIGRCICMIISNYTQSIFQSRISALISFLEEGILPFALIAILIPIFKGTGIWITLTLADTIPILIYFAIILSKRNKYSTLKNCIFMIPESSSFQWTSIRGNFEEIDENMQESNKNIIINIKDLFEDNYLIITGALEDIAKNLFIVKKTISEIDISIIVNDGFILLRFIYDGERYEPFKNKELLENPHMKDLNKMEHDFDYYRMFDLNFTYVKILTE